MTQTKTQYSEKDIRDGAVLLARLMPFLIEAKTMGEVMPSVRERELELTALVMKEPEMQAAFSKEVYDAIRSEVA